MESTTDQNSKSTKTEKITKFRRTKQRTRKKNHEKIISVKNKRVKHAKKLNLKWKRAFRKTLRRQQSKKKPQQQELKMTKKRKARRSCKRYQRRRTDRSSHKLKRTGR